MSYSMFDAEFHTRRPLTPEEQSRLQARMEDLPVMMAEAGPCIEELADISQAPNPQDVARDLDSLLPILDQRWRDEDFAAADQENWVWFAARLMYFIGEWFIHHCGGRWYVSSEPETEFFANCVVGDFTSGLPPLAQISPAMTADNYMRQPPGRSLIGELDRLWRAALAMARDGANVAQVRDQVEYARQAIVEEKEQGSTAKRCLRCGSRFLCSEERREEKTVYTIKCETGCYGMTIYDLQSPVVTASKITVIRGD